MNGRWPSQSGVTIATSLETNKAAVRALYEECLNGGRLDLLPEIVSADYEGPNGEKGVSGVRTTLTGILEAFPDIR